MASRVGVKNAVHAALIACGAAASLPALSLGLGEIEMQSFLNEPLRAEVELLDTRQLTVDDIRIRLAGGEDFDRMGVDRSFFLTSIQFEVVVDEASGRGVIRLSTDEAVLEPYLDVIIEARWPNGRLLREYTVLVDPPVFQQESVTVSASERVEAFRPDKPAIAPTPAPTPAPRPPTNTSDSRGDNVALRESSLGPGEMPDRAFSAATADVPQAGNRYMVRRDETLWEIAQRGRPRGTSVQQAMLDIQRLNPEAFIDGNINQIKAGFIIYLPAEGDISSDNLSRALEEVADQNKQWQASREPGVTAAATLRVSADNEGLDTAPIGDDTAATTGPAATSVAEPRDDTDTSGATAGSAYDSADQGAAAAGASSQLAAQLENMIQRLDTLEQIVSLKDEQIATLEQALREAREAAVTAPAPVTPAPVPVTRPPVQPAPAAPASPLSSIPWLPIGGGVGVLALGVLLLLRRRKASASADNAAAVSAFNDKTSDDPFEGVALKSDALTDPVVDADDEEPVAADENVDLDEAASADESDGSDRGGSRGYGERKHDDYIDEAASGDALAEADIYIAYGRYLQAIELLDSAIETDPSNSAYRVKLIELYVDMGEAESAAEQLTALREYGDDEAIARGEALLGGGTSAAAVGANPFTGDLGDDALPLGVDSIGQFAGDAADALSLDLDDDFDAKEHADTASLELELGDFEPEDLHAAPAPPDPEAEKHIQLGDVQFDDLEIEGDEELEDEEPAFAEQVGFAGDEEELDLSEALNETVEEVGVPDILEPVEDMMVAEDSDQMATKLDLARAYMDMGDSAGARSILEEVAAAGSADQQQEARDLMSRIV